MAKYNYSKREAKRLGVKRKKLGSSKSDDTDYSKRKKGVSKREHFAQTLGGTLDKKTNKVTVSKPAPKAKRQGEIFVGGQGFSVAPEKQDTFLGQRGIARNALTNEYQYTDPKRTFEKPDVRTGETTSASDRQVDTRQSRQNAAAASTPTSRPSSVPTVLGAADASGIPDEFRGQEIRPNEDKGFIGNYLDNLRNPISSAVNQWKNLFQKGSDFVGDIKQRGDYNAATPDERLGMIKNLIIPTASASTTRSQPFVANPPNDYNQFLETQNGPAPRPTSTQTPSSSDVGGNPLLSNPYDQFNQQPGQSLFEEKGTQPEEEFIPELPPTPPRPDYTPSQAFTGGTAQDYTPSQAFTGGTAQDYTPSQAFTGGTVQDQASSGAFGNGALLSRSGGLDEATLELIKTLQGSTQGDFGLGNAQKQLEMLLNNINTQYGEEQRLGENKLGEQKQGDLNRLQSIFASTNTADSEQARQAEERSNNQNQNRLAEMLTQLTASKQGDLTQARTGALDRFSRIEQSQRDQQSEVAQLIYKIQQDADNRDYSRQVDDYNRNYQSQKDAYGREQDSISNRIAASNRGNSRADSRQSDIQKSLSGYATDWVANQPHAYARPGGAEAITRQLAAQYGGNQSDYAGQFQPGWEETRWQNMGQQFEAPKEVGDWIYYSDGTRENSITGEVQQQY